MARARPRTGPARPAGRRPRSRARARPRDSSRNPSRLNASGTIWCSSGDSGGRLGDERALGLGGDEQLGVRDRRSGRAGRRPGLRGAAAGGSLARPARSAPVSSSPAPTRPGAAGSAGTRKCGPAARRARTGARSATATDSARKRLHAARYSRSRSAGSSPLLGLGIALERDHGRPAARRRRRDRRRRSPPPRRWRRRRPRSRAPRPPPAAGAASGPAGSAAGAAPPPAGSGAAAAGAGGAAAGGRGFVVVRRRVGGRASQRAREPRRARRRRRREPSSRPVRARAWCARALPGCDPAASAGPPTA